VFGQTSYVAIIGEDTCWPTKKRLSLSDLTDGTSNTMLLTEMHDSGIAWSEPRDLEAAKMDWHLGGTLRGSPSSMHGPHVQYLDGSRHLSGPPPVNVAMADGSVRTLAPNTDPEVLRQLANRHDGH